MTNKAIFGQKKWPMIRSHFGSSLWRFPPGGLRPSQQARSGGCGLASRWLECVAFGLVCLVGLWISCTIWRELVNGRQTSHAVGTTSHHDLCYHQCTRCFQCVPCAPATGSFTFNLSRRCNDPDYVVSGVSKVAEFVGDVGFEKLPHPMACWSCSSKYCAHAPFNHDSPLIINCKCARMLLSASAHCFLLLHVHCTRVLPFRILCLTRPTNPRIL